MLDYIVPVLTAVAGLVAGGYFQQWLSDRSERRRLRRDALRRLAAYRYQIATGANLRDGEFWSSLNEVFVSFGDDAEVVEALHRYRDDVEHKRVASGLVALMKAMAKSAEIPATVIESDIVQNPFVPPSTNGEP